MGAPPTGTEPPMDGRGCLWMLLGGIAFWACVAYAVWSNYHA